MRSFWQVASKHFEQPYFHFLYVGAQSSRWDALRHAVEAMGCFETIRAITIDELRKDANAGVERKEFGVDVYRGCLIQVWDLFEECSGAELADVLNGLPFDPVWSSQLVLFGVTPAGPGLRFRDFIEGIGHEFAGVGDVDACVEAIGAWCTRAGAADGPLSLRVSCAKKPAFWLRNIRHDYFGNLISASRIQRLLGMAELQKQQISIDFWQDATRNVLSFPFQNKPARNLGQDQSDRESSVDLIRRIATSPCELIVPRGMEGSLAGCGWTEGGEFSLYSSPEEAVACLEAGAGRGHARIIVRNNTLFPGDATSAAAFAQVPSVLVGEPEVRLPWQGWTKALSENVLGSFSSAEFLNTGDPLPAVKAAYWKPFCFVTLPESVDHILDLMIETYAGLEALGEDSDKDLASLFRCLAQVWCAKALYFGDSSPSLSPDSAKPA